jgi:hypothetical protein
MSASPFLAPDTEEQHTASVEVAELQGQRLIRLIMYCQVVLLRCSLGKHTASVYCAGASHAQPNIGDAQAHVDSTLTSRC